MFDATDATLDIDGKFRIHPQSTASLRIVRELSGAVTVTNVGDCPAILNGEAICRHGQDRFYLGPGRRKRFAAREMAGV